MSPREQDDDDALEQEARVEREEKPISKLSNNIHVLQAMIVKFVQEARTDAAAISELRGEVVELKSELTQVSKILRDGNGHPPVTSRLAILEEFKERQAKENEKASTTLRDAMEEIKKDLGIEFDNRFNVEKIKQELYNNEIEKKAQDARNRKRKVTIEMALAIAAIVVSLVDVVFPLLFPK